MTRRYGEPPTETVPDPPRVGETVAGKYQVERVLGKGGMGVVVAAHHMQLDQKVAMKFLLPTATFPGAVSRFLREARAAARLQNEHVARVLDVGTLDNGAPFIVMEYLTGKDLATILHERGPLPFEEAIDYVLQACEAVGEAHSIGIVHRDLKPSNLFLADRADGHPCVKLLDFGIAKATSDQSWAAQQLTGTGSTMGSPQYMSPEHVRETATVDARTDIWSLGVILHELVSKLYPFSGGSPAALCAAIAADAPIPVRRHRRDAPEALEKIILRCLEKRPELRYQTIAELAVGLAPFAPETSTVSLGRIARLAKPRPSSSGADASGPNAAIASSPDKLEVVTAKTMPSGNIAVKTQPTPSDPYGPTLAHSSTGDRHDTTGAPHSRDFAPPRRSRALYVGLGVGGLIVIAGAVALTRGRTPETTNVPVTETQSGTNTIKTSAPVQTAAVVPSALVTPGGETPIASTAPQASISAPAPTTAITIKSPKGLPKPSATSSVKTTPSAVASVSDIPVKPSGSTTPAATGGTDVDSIGPRK
jgi:serine/threonine-protein kinase